jgi:hypothetical protein
MCGDYALRVLREEFSVFLHMFVCVVCVISKTDLLSLVSGFVCAVGSGIVPLGRQSLWCNEVLIFSVYSKSFTESFSPAWGMKTLWCNEVLIFCVL